MPEAPRSALTGIGPEACGLYAITPDSADTLRLLAGVEAVLAGGCSWLQYRDKISSTAERLTRARCLATLCASYGAKLIINDDVELARQSGAAGVHLGRGDGAVGAARALLGPGAIIGASCYNDFRLAQFAVAAGASYVAFGAVFPSSTKPSAALAPLALFARARTELGIPLCAIGGITLERGPELIAAGAHFLAVIADLFDDLSSVPAMTAQARAYQRLF